MSKKIKIVIGIIIVIVVVVLLSQKRGDNGPIKIGFIGPLTGDVSNLGVISKSAVELATKEMNDAGGINGRKVEVLYEDGKCTPVVALNSANKLLNVDHVSAIIGGMCSGETSSFIKNATEMKIPVISYCSSAPSLSNSGPMFFRTYPSDSYQGKYAAMYAYNVLKIKKIAILYHISDWGTGLKDVFTKTFTELGGTIVATEGATQETKDYRTQLSKIKAQNPEYIYMAVYTDGGLISIQQSVDLGIKAKLLGTDTWNDPKFVSSVNQKADITYVGSTNNPSQDFSDKLMKFAQVKEVPICAPQAYDATNVLFSAIKESGLDGEAISKSIHSTKYSGVNGPVEFDQNGDIVATNYVIRKIINNKLVEIK